MMLNLAFKWRVAVIALVLAFAGCSDFSQHRFGGVRRLPAEEAVPAKPAAALYIPNAPLVLRAADDQTLKQVAFVPERDAPMQPQLAENPLRVLYQRAADRHAAMESYIFRLKRREVVAGRKQPEEVIRVEVRTNPYSVHLKWLGNEGKGREVIYVKGKYKNEMQLRLAGGDMFPFSPAGMRYELAPDDPQARAKCRHAITETGFGAMIESYGRTVAGIEKGDPREGTLQYLGRIERPEFPGKVDAVLQVIPANADALLPKGGKRWLFFDPTHGLPVLRITHDPNGEVEYYCHDHIQWPVRLDDDDFNPDRLWRK